MESSDFINKQKELLNDLRKENLLTEEEFQKKLNAINNKEEEENKDRKEKEIDRLTKENIRPLVNKLEASVKAGLLSQEDYESKKNLLYTDQRKKIVETNQTTDLS